MHNEEFNLNCVVKPWSTTLCRLAMVFALVSWATIPTDAQAVLVSADFGSTGSSPTFIGVEPAAAALNPIFGDANQWNSLNTPSLALTTNPQFPNLVDNTGLVSPIGFQINDNVGSYYIGGHPLFADYFYWHSSGVSNKTINWEITGLAAANSYALVLYGGSVGGDRDADFLVDTDGDGQLNDETVQSLINGGSVFSSPLYYPVVVADASGRIVGSSTATGNLVFFEGEANWAGFQIASLPVDPVPEPSSLDAVPEPSSIALAIFGLLSHGFYMRRKCRRRELA